MTAVMAILIGLCGVEVAKKVYMLIKMLGINIEGYTEKDFEELLSDPKFLKYMR